MITTVYALLDPRNQEVRYVGKSINPDLRLYQHNKCFLWNETTAADPLYLWVASLHSKGLKPKMIELEEYGTEDCYGETEKFWILYMISLGANLLNKAVVFAGWNSPPPAKINRSLMLDRDSYFALRRLEDGMGISGSQVVGYALSCLEERRALDALEEKQRAAIRDRELNH